MRYHWVRDRVKDGIFKLVWAPGTASISDFLTKIHSPARCIFMRQFYYRPTALLLSNLKVHSLPDRRFLSELSQLNVARSVRLNPHFIRNIQ